MIAGLRSVGALAPIELDELVARAARQTRIDRKYVLPVAAVSLLRRFERCRPSSTNSAAAAIDAAEESSPVSADTGVRSAGTRSTIAASSSLFRSSPVWTTSPSSNASTIAVVCDGSTRSL